MANRSPGVPRSGGCGCGSESLASSKEEASGAATSTTCYRCAEQPATLLTRKASCRACFLEVLHRSIASNIRARCVGRTYSAQPLLLLVSGDIFSTSLLHLILSRNKRRFLNASHNPPDSAVAQHLLESDDLRVPCILSLDHHVGVPGTFSDRSEQFFRHVTTVVNAAGGPVEDHAPGPSSCCLEEATVLSGRLRLAHVSPCYFLHDSGGGEKPSSEACDDRCHILMEALCALHRAGGRDELLYAMSLLGTLNLRSFMRTSGYEQPLLGVSDTQELVAQRVLTLTCLGAGQLVASRSAFVDEELLDGAGRVVRPLKSFSNKEIALYHRLNALPALAPPAHLWSGAAQSSIVGCVSELMSTLTSAHCSTLHNICTVVEKLVGAPVVSASAAAGAGGPRHLGAYCQVCNASVYVADAGVTCVGVAGLSYSSLNALCQACAFLCSRSVYFREFAGLMAAHSGVLRESGVNVGAAQLRA